jgi:hypothetical protein
MCCIDATCYSNKNGLPRSFGGAETYPQRTQKSLKLLIPEPGQSREELGSDHFLLKKAFLFGKARKEKVL